MLERAVAQTRLMAQLVSPLGGSVRNSDCFRSFPMRSAILTARYSDFSWTGGGQVGLHDERKPRRLHRLRQYEVLKRRGGDSNPRDGLSRQQHFQCCSFSHSDTSPNCFLDKHLQQISLPETSDCQPTYWISYRIPARQPSQLLRQRGKRRRQGAESLPPPGLQVQLDWHSKICDQGCRCR